jgi:dTDP-glucose 4,6-dehydratase
MKLLITGGCGFIGSNFIKHILKDPSVQKVVNVDLLTYAGVRASCVPFEDDPRYFFVHADIADAEAMDVIFLKHEIDVVLNFAAESHVDRSILDPHAFVKTNLVGTSVLLEAVRRRGVERFIQISTDEVYGSLGLNDPSFHEKTLLNPRNPYSKGWC